MRTVTDLLEWVDTHCHLDDERTPGGPLAALDAARAAGVRTMISVGTDATRSGAAIELASQHADVWATVGLHPHDAVQGVDSIRHLLGSPKVVAIGECGLDYHYDHSPRPEQRRAFAEQIALAHEHGLTLVIHTREAWEDAFDVLTAEGVPPRTVFHCFTGGPEEARRCVDVGAYLSFSGIVTFPNAADVQDAARWCPTDHLLVETDSPYLAPVPHRGRPNQPALVPLVGAALAALRDTPVPEIAMATSANARLAFPAIAP
jgi:TatD DNase family protein